MGKAQGQNSTICEMASRNYDNMNGLAWWVARQRKLRAHENLPEHLIRRLDCVGFVWDFPNMPTVRRTRASWESYFRRLVDYHNRHGHCDMKLVIPLDKQLPKWAQEQRWARQSGTLTADQIDKLDQLGFVWNTEDSP